MDGRAFHAAFAIELREHVATRGLGNPAIETTLERREVALDDRLGARREFFCDVFFGTTQHEGFESRAQRAHGLLIAIGDRILETAAERGFAAEQTRLDEGKDRPQVSQRIFDRGAGERETMIGAQIAHDPRDLRTRVLRVLRFIEDERAKIELLENRGIEARERVGRDHDIGVVDLFEPLRAIAARLEAQRLEIGGEARDLRFPRMRDRGRRDDERGRATFGLLASQQIRNHLNCLAGPHVIGKHAAEFERREIGEKVQTFALVTA